ncbi:high-affinity branched-chain amino acid ABC transporter permease LivM [Oleisolibacter albus]|uniref:high-affinity branched-chain amino acid ABC transporter permease LivM n=1 Tax=Oleisolibacter albus TaxID=2171757 RepID=UPI000DF1D5A9|nr:high-affinity branched-chain amino acid ABC transporter permease LivM [Oleisolibacter albus]
MASTIIARLPARLRDAALAALLALVLGIPFIGLQTLSTDQGLAIGTRWPWLLAAAAVIFAGRLLFAILADLLAERRRTARAGRSLVSEALAGRLTRGFGIGAALFALTLPFLPFSDRYVLDIGMTALIYILLGMGLNVTVGLAGLLDLGFVAFYAIGAYTFALLSKFFGFGFWLSLPLSGLVAASFGVLLSLPILRLRGDYLAIVTLGFGEITRIILLNWQSLTGGPNGVSGIPRPSLFGLSFDRRPPEGLGSFHEVTGIAFSGEHRLMFLYFVALGLVLVASWGVWRLRHLPIGRSWEALREDEIACRSLGINPTASKVSAYATGAFLGGLAGCFFAARQGFVSPESFTFIESALILAIVVLGGMGSQIGVVIAALFIVLLPEFARDFADYRMLIFGAAMILIMIWRPQGLLSNREPTLRLAGRSAAGDSAAKEATP